MPAEPAGVQPGGVLAHAGHLLLYSSDYPHDHGSDALDNLLVVLSEQDRAAVLTKNAAEFFRIAVPAQP